MFEPTDYTTWTTFNDHPIFTDRKSDVANWSHEPARYDELKSYGCFLPECYVHLLPPPPVEKQIQAAERDIRNFRSCCEAIEAAFGPIRHELIILDDYTALVEIQHVKFSVTLYTDSFPDGVATFSVFSDRDDTNLDEEICESSAEIIERIRRSIWITDEEQGDGE